MIKMGILLSSCLLVAACATRQAAPVAVNQVGDDNLSCSQLTAELHTNESKFQQLQKESDNERVHNIAVGTVGTILFWPALFALDFDDAEQVEMQAIRDRNNRIQLLQQKLGC